MSFFKRPTWAKTSTVENNEDGTERNLFSHSRSFQDIIDDSERRKNEKAERKKVKKERGSSGKHKRGEDGEGGELKKRRFTVEDGEALFSKVGLPAVIPGEDEEDEVSVREATEPVRRSPRRNKEQLRGAEPDTPVKRSKLRTEVVEIEDGDDGDEPLIQHVTAAEQNAEDGSDDNDEFAELRRQARLKREQQNKDQAGASHTSMRGHSSGRGEDYTSLYDPMFENEPVVQLFIEPRIPNTSALLVQRKLSQRLEEVRKAWCKKQGFEPHFWPEVFFVHRMHRLYDVTTCRSLGLEVDAFGELTMKGAEGKEGVEKVHLVAVTKEIYTEMLAERDLEAKRRSGELPPEDQAESGAADEEIAKEQSQIRITLKAKDKQDLRIKIKPTHPFSKLEGAYRKSRLDDDQTVRVRLEFDGDTLDPNEEVQSTDISDHDIIHVYLS